MGFLGNLLDRVNGSGKTAQGATISQVHRDWDRKGESFSVECQMSDSLADLMLMGSNLPVTGDSERASWLDSVADSFMRKTAGDAISTAFLTGDCLIVPSWNGRNVQHLIVPAYAFEIYECAGDEILSCGYVSDTRKRRGQVYNLVQMVELVETETGHANRYSTYCVKGTGATVPLDTIPEWGATYEPEWVVPGVDRLLVGRYKSFTRDPRNMNNAKGVPICYGAGEFIEEIHYLLAQMHVEFGFSEKAIMASKRMFEVVDDDGKTRETIPRGKRRLFIKTRGSAKGDGEELSEWAPEIRYQAYLDDINEQQKLVEKAVGVSTGIISTPNDVNYENVDNVRKSQTKTMGFISTARKQAESMLETLVYTWDVLANYYGITPMGEYEVQYDWSDDYIETFADKQNAILAGEAIGATDAVDYRMFLYGESYDVATARVNEIQASRMMAYE